MFPFTKSALRFVSENSSSKACDRKRRLRTVSFSAPSPESLGLRCVQNGPPARRSEPDWPTRQRLIFCGLSEQPLLLEKSNDIGEPGSSLEITHHEWPFSSHFLCVAPHDIEISADVGG